MFSHADLNKVIELAAATERRRCAKIVRKAITCKCKNFCECYGRQTLLDVVAEINGHGKANGKLAGAV